MADRLDETLKWGWGYDALRPPQRQAIEAALAGKDSLVILPTGGGKSICFQLPALVGEGPCLVVSPLIALMEDQVQAARQAVSAAALHSDLPPQAQGQIMRDYQAGHIRLLYTSPERLAHSRLIEDLKQYPPALIAIDEAHCISSWGHDFRPEYRQLATLLDSLKAPRMALTATATPKVADDIAGQLRLDQPLRIIAPVQRANLCLRTLPRQDRRQQISDLLNTRRGQCGIVYCRRRKDTEELADYFAGQGHRCAPFHAGLPAEQKSQTLAAFMQDRLDLVFATVAFGMGIDRPDVRFVVHAAMPSSLEAYVQEAGRAGRDGAPADCILLHSGEDVRTAMFFIDEENPDQARRESLEKALWRMLDYARKPSCRHRQIAAHFGQELAGGGNCGNACDVCRGEIETLDDDEALIVTELVIDCIRSTGQRFGRKHIAALLAGSKAERIRKWRHDQHALHGRLKGYGEKGLIPLFDQLEAQGFLQTGEQGGYPVLELGSATIDPSQAPVLAHQKVVSRKQTQPKQVLRDRDQALFDKLKAWRTALASSRGVPAYVIASDRSLKHLSVNRPTSREELRAIHGFGAVKVDQLAGEILPLIRAEVAD